MGDFSYTGINNPYQALKDMGLYNLLSSLAAKDELLEVMIFSWALILLN
jgi:hypothetical protein